MMDESDLILEFMKISKCNRNDAISCLSLHRYDLKKALIDYNGKINHSISGISHMLLTVSDTSTQNYFKTKTKDNQDADDVFPLHVNSVDVRQSIEDSKMTAACNLQDIRNSGSDIGSTSPPLNFRPLLTKTDSIDLDCEYRFHVT